MFKKLINGLRVWWYNRGKVTEVPANVPVQPTKPEPQAPIVGNKELWYPKAVKGSGMKTQGEYRKEYPEGCIIHFTAGRCSTEQEAKDSLSWGISNGYAFFVIGPTGVVYQNFPLNRWGHHAGISSHPAFGSSVSKYLVGIEVACAGMVTPLPNGSGKAWFGMTYPPEKLRKVLGKDNVQAGTYVKYTPEQEKSLEELILWLHLNNPGVFKLDYVLGHDSVAPTRKDDPGGSLSMTIPEYQKYLKAKLK